MPRRITKTLKQLSKLVKMSSPQDNNDPQYGENVVYAAEPQEPHYPTPPPVPQALWNAMPEREREDWRNQQVAEYLQAKEDYFTRLFAFHRAKLDHAIAEGDRDAILINQAALNEARHNLHSAEQCRKDWTLRGNLDQ